MWFIKYGEIDKATKQRIMRTSLLETGVVYTLGKDSNCSFKVESKSLSGNDLKFFVQAIDYPNVSPILKLQILASSAKVNDALVDHSHLTEEERLRQDFSTFKSTVTIVIGTFKVRIYHQLMLLKLSPGSGLDLSELEKLGVIYNDRTLPKTTHIITETPSYSLNIMSSLIRGIPIVSKSFIQEIINKKNLIRTNFEANFPNPDDFVYDSSYKKAPQRKSLFDKIVFIFGDLNQYEIVHHILESAMAKVVLYQFSENSTVEGFIDFVEKETPEGYRFVLVKIQTPQVTDFLTSVYNVDGKEYQNLILMNDAAKKLEIYLTTNEQIFDAVKNLDLEILLRKRQTKSISPPLTSDQPPKKKRRSKVQALNSLDFFAGGLKTESQNMVKPEILPIQELPLEEPSVTQVPDSVEPLEEPAKKKRRTRVQALPNLLIQRSTLVESEPAEPRDSATENQPPETDATESQLQDHKAERNELETPKTQPEVKEEEEAPPTKPIQKIKETQSLSSAFIESKKRNDERIKKELGFDEDIDEESIGKMQNLAIVETFEIIPRNRTSAPSSQGSVSTTTHPEWKGRKNFKVFVKNTAKKHSLGNQSFLQTREYLRFKEYNPHEDDKVSKASEEMLNHIEREKRIDENREKEETFSFRNQSTLRQPTMVDTRPISTHPTEISLFVESDDDEDDAEGFQFSNTGGYNERDGLGMNIRPTTIQDIPEFNRNMAREPTEKDKQLNAISKLTTARNSSPSFEDDDDDDDDDNDVPRFRFRS